VTEFVVDESQVPLLDEKWIPGIFDEVLIKLDKTGKYIANPELEGNWWKGYVSRLPRKPLHFDVSFAGRKIEIFSSISFEETKTSWRKFHWS
jgi:hypothetical protein